MFFGEIINDINYIYAIKNNNMWKLVVGRRAVVNTATKCPGNQSKKKF